MTKSENLHKERDFTKKGWRRRILIRALIALSVIAVALAVVGIWVAKALPGIAAAEISRLTNTRIEMGSFDFRHDASVFINGLVVRPEREQLFYDDAILLADSVYAKFSLRSLLLLAPRVTEIRIQDFRLDVQCDLDSGQWNVGGLQLNVSSPIADGPVPTISLVEGKLRYCRVSGGEVDVAMSVPIEARLGPSGRAPRRYEFEIKTATLSGGYGKSHLTGSWQPGRFELAGGLSSTDIPSLERAWAVDVLAAELTYDQSRNYEFELRAKDLHSKHSPQVDAFRLFDPDALKQSGPLATVQRFFARFRPFGTVGQIAVKAVGYFDALNESEITGKVICKDVSINDSRFPYPLDHLGGQVDFTQSMVVLNDLSAKHGDVDVRIEGWTRGYGDERQYRYEITSDNMVLDQDLYAALPSDQKRLWDAFDPSGHAAIAYELTRSTPTDKRSEISVALKDVAATYQRFPYPLEGLTGQVVFDPNQVVVSDVATQDGGVRVRLNGKVTGRRTGKPVYDITIDADDVPLDATLRDALPAQQRQLYRQFDARGFVDVRARVLTADVNGAAPVTFVADLSFDQMSLKVEGLPAPLTAVSAQATLTPRSLRIAQATGRYGQSQVSLSGELDFTDDGRMGRYGLGIATEKTLLDRKVIELLPASMRDPVSVFQPEGPVNLRVDLTKADANAPPAYSIVVDCLGNKITCARFTYPLDDVRGTVRIDPEVLTVEGVTAKPALQVEPGLDPLIEIAGRVSLVPQTRGQGAFTLQGRDLLFTRELGAALPEDMVGVYRDLAPRGPFDVNLPTLKISNGADGRRRVEFGGQANLRTCSLSVSGAGAEVRGTLRIDGLYDTKQGLSRGRVQLAAERLRVKSKDVTDLNADLIYDPNARVWSARNFLGHAYDGKVLGSLEIARDGPGVLQYLVTVALNRVSLQPFLLAGKLGKEADRNYTSGTMNAVLSMGAKVGDGSSRLGLCRVDVADMQVAKVSPLANLLAVLSLTEPTDYAFERMLIESYLRRNKLLISKFDMSGKNLAFVGAGTMNLTDGSVNLMLTARGRRLAATQPSLLQSLTEGIGGAMVRMEVTGKADSPKVETKTLPVLEDSLKILGTPR
ncbi:MAG: hypothetical protein JW993_17005 [Sedimentisphaerales bacterium]|nr:hypothetical protein [Sedimentisphaerales bacterium]